jgi:hypothetical protein
VPENGGVELYVTMHNGSVYSFTAYTPAQIDGLMQRNGWLSFVDMDTLIIKERSMEAIMHALTQVLLLDIKRFGIEVNPPEPTPAYSALDDPWAGL